MELVDLQVMVHWVASLVIMSAVEEEVEMVEMVEMVDKEELAQQVFLRL